MPWNIPLVFSRRQFWRNMGERTGKLIGCFVMIKFTLIKGDISPFKECTIVLSSSAAYCVNFVVDWQNGELQRGLKNAYWNTSLLFVLFPETYYFKTVVVLHPYTILLVECLQGLLNVFPIGNHKVEWQAHVSKDVGYACQGIPFGHGSLAHLHCLETAPVIHTICLLGGEFK